MRHEVSLFAKDATPSLPFRSAIQSLLHPADIPQGHLVRGTLHWLSAMNMLKSMSVTGGAQGFLGGM
jgi:hypothetical protein